MLSRQRRVSGDRLVRVRRRHRRTRGKAGKIVNRGRHRQLHGRHRDGRATRTAGLVGRVGERVAAVHALASLVIRLSRPF